MISYLGNDDPTTKRLLESILAKEEEHAEDLSNMLRVVAARPPPKAVSA
jgi:bacterioferritin